MGGQSKMDQTRPVSHKSLQGSYLPITINSRHPFEKLMYFFICKRTHSFELNDLSVINVLSIIFSERKQVRKTIEELSSAKWHLICDNTGYVRCVIYLYDR